MLRSGKQGEWPIFLRELPSHWRKGRDASLRFAGTWVLLGIELEIGRDQQIEVPERGVEEFFVGALDLLRVDEREHLRVGHEEQFAAVLAEAGGGECDCAGLEPEEGRAAGGGDERGGAAAGGHSRK